jgi:hypothetical protein
MRRFFDPLQNAVWTSLINIETYWAQLRHSGMMRGECGTCKLNCRCWVHVPAHADRTNMARCIRRFTAGLCVCTCIHAVRVRRDAGAASEAALHAARQHRYDATLLRGHCSAPNVLVSEICKVHKIRSLNEYKRV